MMRVHGRDAALPWEFAQERSEVIKGQARERRCQMTFPRKRRCYGSIMDNSGFVSSLTPPL